MASQADIGAKSPTVSAPIDVTNGGTYFLGKSFVETAVGSSHTAIVDSPDA